MTQVESTFAPLSSEEWPDELAHLRASFADRLSVYRVMARHPALLSSWAPLRGHIVSENALGAERQEVTILRVSARLNATYEWSHHVDRAGRLGMAPDRISSIAGSPEEMSDEDALVCRAVDELLDTTRLSDGHRDALAQRVGTEGVFDLMATVGFYVTLGFIVNSFDVPLDEGIEQVPIPGRDPD